ncbi:MAG: beta-propeller fold lactonase family protein [Spirochaetaceae bacterium]|nr:beta-propeller fold lactonase family protein [Spirochaetaceae bacterium]
MKKVLFAIICIAAITTMAIAQSQVVPADTASGELRVTKIGTFKCGKQPKQVLFSPDDAYIVMPLLDENGFDIFSLADKKVIKRIVPPNGDKLGFVEGLFIPEKNAFFVSQMTTGKIYEYTYPGFEYRREISTEGTWSKFMVWSGEKSIIAVSNWTSNNISIIDYDTGKVLRKIKTKLAPRGMVFTDGGKSIISLSFDSGVIEKFDTATGNRTGVIEIDKAAMRHVVLSPDEKTAYISDMYHAQVLAVNLDKFEITDKVKVFNNPNTIDLWKGRYLFVSSRGPNNPVDYTLRSPKDGIITVIDTKDMSVVAKIQGGNQPTGLDISNGGKYLCFSNFQDENIELYELSE